MSLSAFTMAVVAAPAALPACQVRGIAHEHGVTRELARQRVRVVLADQAGAAYTARLRRSPREAPPPGPVAVSHEPGLSLLAWCAHGCLGIDVVDVAALCALPADELLGIAALYLGPRWQRDVADPGDVDFGAHAGADTLSLRLAHAWARHEARLKCCGVGLTEWSAHGQGGLADCSLWPVVLPPVLAGTDAQRWVAWLAWRPAGAAPHDT